MYFRNVKINALRNLRNYRLFFENILAFILWPHKKNKDLPYTHLTVFFKK